MHVSDHHDRYRRIEENFVRWARDRPDVRAAIVIGSRARADHPADEFSDLDLVAFVDDPASLIEDEHWFESFGHVVLSFTEGTAIGAWRERRVLFDDALNVDFVILPSDIIRAHDSVEWLAASEDVAPVIGRGVRVLLDKHGVLGQLAELRPKPIPWIAPKAEAFLALVRDYWYHAQWVMKKLARGEVLTAVTCLNGLMQRRLVTMIEWNIRAAEPAADTWHEGRFFEQWAPASIQGAFAGTISRLGADEATQSLHTSMTLFGNLARETADELGFDYPAQEEQAVRDWVNTRLR